MINVYQKTNLDFTKNGDATLQPIRCDLSMEINGAWSLEIEVPYDEEGKWQYLVEGSIVIVDVDCIRELSNTKQRFRVYDYKKGISSLTAIAFPVAMESTHDAPIENVVITNKTGAQAMTQLQAFTNKYTLYSNIANTGSTALSNTNVNSAIASGKDDCFIQIWGGEICYDNLKFSVLNRLGENQAEKHPVIYGRNMTDVSYEKDDSGLITRLYPISQDGIRLSYGGKSYVDSPKISDYPIIHSRFIQAPYKLVIDDISNGSQTAVLTRSIQSQISTLVNTLSHSVYNSAVANKVEPEYIKKIRSDIVEAVQDMATANIYHADMNKIMRASIKSSMDWLKDVSKPTWTWHGDGSPSNPYWYGASESSRATSEWVYVDRIWRYFGANSYWQRPKDDSSKKWDWIQKSNGYFYGNNERYYAQKTYVYITMEGQMKEYWFDEDGYWDGSDDTDSDYTWHQSGDAWWFGEDGATAEDTSKFLHDGWWFIDGVYYYFDENGYWIDSQDTTKRDFQWDWVETSNSKWWFGNDADHEFMHIWVQNQWLKIGGDWYRFGSDNYAVGGTALETEIINLFKTGMAQVKTTCETLNTQAYTLLYNLMKGYCDRSFAYEGIDVPTVTITVNMVDLSQTIEYKDYKNLEKVCLGDNVKCVDYEHGISTTERVVSITYDCIRRYNSTVTIGVAESTVADKLGVNAGGGEASGGFDTSVIESTLTNHTNELARLDSAKQNKLTAGENITIVNDVISATGGGHGDCTCYYGVGAPKSSLGNDGDIYADISPDESGCKALTYHRSSNLHDVTANASEGIYDINGSWWTDRYEHTYTLYSISGLTAGEVYTVSFRLKFNRAMTFYDNDEFIGIAVQNSGSCEYRSNPPRNGEFKSYLDTQYKVYIQSVKTTAEWQSYTFEFTAMNANYLGLYFDGIVNGEDFDVDIDNLYISDGTIGDSLTDLYVKVDGEWLVYDNGTHYVAGSNITITKVDGQMVISATDTTYNNFVGATSENNGSAGLVPAPQTSERNKYLKGDGTWAEVQGASAVSDLTDVSLNNLSNNQILKWNSTTQKWENASGGGGSDVEANPSDPATDTLNTIGIDGTVYELAGGGGGSSSGVYVEDELYTATSTSFTDITVDWNWDDYDFYVFWVHDNPYTQRCGDTTILTKKQIKHLVDNSLDNVFYRYDNNYVIYTFGSNQLTTSAKNGSHVIIQIIGVKTSGDYYSPVIYSTEEREIGVWTDNKPLYQKTITLTSKQAQIDISGLNIDTYVKSESVYRIGDYVFEMPRVADSTSNYERFISVYYTDLNSGYISFIWGNDVSSVDELHITLQYTKTTDVAGSGTYNTLGVPTVHYTTDEQVIGTWVDGKPLYRKTVIKSGTISQRETISLGIANVENIFLVSDASNVNNGQTPLPLVTGTDNSNNTGGFFDIQQSDTSFLFRIGNGMVGYVENAIITVQYTKTTDV